MPTRHARLSGEADMTRTTIRRLFFWLLKNTLNRKESDGPSRHGPFSLIRHVGRKSARTYETPVILVQVPGGFTAELTYGENVNRYRNIVAAGRVRRRPPSQRVLRHPHRAVQRRVRSRCVCRPISGSS
jgi:hypothetical protein